MTDDNVIHADFAGRRKRTSAPRKKPDADVLKARRVQHEARRSLREMPKKIGMHREEPPAWTRISQTVNRTADGRNWAAQLLLSRVRSETEAKRWGRGADLFSESKVRQLTVEDSIISALVQGTQPSPFAVSIQLPDRDEKLTQYLTGAIATAPAGMFALTTGRVPGADLPGFVLRDDDRLRYSCECPDPTSPCKHVAALIVAAGSKIDIEPRTILDLRGIDPEALAQRIEFERSGTRRPTRAIDSTPPAWDAPPREEPDEPEEASQRPNFWGEDMPLPEIPEVPTAPAILEADQKLFMEALDTACFGGRDTINLANELAEAYRAMIHIEGDHIDGELADIIDFGPKR